MNKGHFGRLLLLASIYFCALKGIGQSNSPLPNFWKTNGPVYTTLRVGDTLYLGGDFSELSQVSSYGVSVKISDALIQSQSVQPNGLIRSVISDGQGGWYIGGDFTMVGNQPRSRIARINADGSLNGWSPEVNNSVYTLCLFAGKLYFGGLFTNVAGVQRNRIAAVDAITGALDAWNPNAENTVRTLLAVQGNIIAGGNFYTIGGQIRNGLAMLDPATGLASPWNPSDPTVTVEVASLVSIGNYLYVGGKFAKLGGLARTNTASIDLTTGLAGAWNPRANNTVHSLVQVGNVIYMGGAFTSVAGIARSFLAAVDTTSGNVGTWNPAPNSTVYCLSNTGSILMVGGDFTAIGGRDRAYVAAIDLNTGKTLTWNLNANGGCRSLAVYGDIVYLGGLFTSFGMGEPRQNLAALNAVTGAPLAWNPGVDGIVQTMAARDSSLYLGGSFSQIGLAKPFGVRVTHSTLTYDQNYVRPNGNVYTAIPDGSGGWYIGGAFTRVGNQIRNRLARINADGTLHPWNPDANGDVRSMVTLNNSIMVGGSFTRVDDQVRNSIAAIHPESGAVTSWNPNTTGTVHVLAVKQNTSLIVGGDFTSIGGQARSHLAELDSTTGKATIWRPNPNGPVYAIEPDANTIYVGGAFTSISGETRNRIAALDGNTGIASAWDPNANGNVLSIKKSVGIDILVGGSFTTIGGQPRKYLAMVNQSTGVVTAWNPNPNGEVHVLSHIPNWDFIFVGGDFTEIGGKPRRRVAELYLGFDDGRPTDWAPLASGRVSVISINTSSGSTRPIYLGGSFKTMGGEARANIAAVGRFSGLPLAFNPGSNAKVNAIEVGTDGSLYAGGDFTTMGGQPRNYIAKLDRSTGAVLSWNPNLDRPVRALKTTGNKVFAGGVFTKIGATSQRCIAAFDHQTGSLLNWYPKLEFNQHPYSAYLPVEVNAITTKGSQVYFGGILVFGYGGTPKTILAVADTASGNLLEGWKHPVLSFSPADTILKALSINDNTLYIGGQFQLSTAKGASVNMGAVSLDSGTVRSWVSGICSNCKTSDYYELIKGVRTISAHENYIYVGGDFTTIGQQERPYFAAFTTCLNPPATPAITKGSTGVLTSSASTGNQWYLNGLIIPGATQASYTPMIAGNYYVVVTSGGCSSPLSNTIFVCIPPLPPTASTTSYTYCSGTYASMLTANPPAGASVVWYNAATGSNGRSVEILPSTSTPGTYTYYAASDISGCESTTRLPITVQIKPTPSKPTIIRDGAGQLVSSSIVGNQWYKDSIPVSGANGQTYLPSVTGNYKVQVTIDGCPSPFSDLFNFIPTGIVNFGNNQYLHIWPNPVREYIRIDFNLKNEHHLRASLRDVSGIEVLKKSGMSSGSGLEVGSLPPGTYMLIIFNSKNYQIHSERLVIAR